MPPGVCPFTGRSAQPKADGINHELQYIEEDPAAGVPLATGQTEKVPSTGGCPFRNLHITAKSAVDKIKEAVTGSQDLKSAAKAAGCPFHAQIPESSAGEASKQAPSKCPFLASAAQPSTPMGSEAKCPLGYTSGGTQKLSAFHCVLCKSLLCDCVRTACGHMYCRGCIEKFNDCPICGAETAPLKPDLETQARVDLYIQAHADSHSIWELEGLGRSSTGEEEPRGRSNFLLQLGLRALAGGNTPAGKHWLERCQAVLEETIEEKKRGKAAQKAEDGVPRLENVPECALATVHGCLGDCARSQGQVEEALSHYTASARMLEDPAVDSNEEVQQTLSVTLNKIAELHHMQGDVRAALPYYRRALHLRQQLLESAEQRELTNPPSWAGLALPVMTSLVKTADAEASLGEQESANDHSKAARALLVRVKSHERRLAPALLHKLGGLEAYLEPSAPQ